MFPTLKTIGGFLHKNRNKILIASVVAVSVAVYMHYSGSEGELAPNALENDEDSDKDSTNEGEKGKGPVANEQQMSPGNRARVLLRIRRQFDMAAQHFLPTIRIKIVEVVDINGTVRQIKELRAKSSENNRQLETQLWEEIKISSFTMLFVTAYMLSAVCVMLRVQLCLLAHSAGRSSAPNSSSARSSNGTNTNGEEEVPFDNEMFKALIDGAYKHLFNSGLRTFTAVVNHRVTTDLKFWVVQEKTSVSFGDLLHTVTAMRQTLEAEMPATVQSIFIPPSALMDNGSPSDNNRNGSSGRTSPQVTVQRLMDQTWDLVESPMFARSYAESVDACFRLIFDHLRHSAFMAEAQASVVSPTLKTLPLASLLPQIKAVATRLLPSSTEQPLGAEIRDISSGPCLESFCVSIFDAPLPH